jgi:hypothetical protein
MVSYKGNNNGCFLQLGWHIIGVPTDKILKRQCIIHIVSTVEFSWSIQQHRFNFVGAFSNTVCTR